MVKQLLKNETISIDYVKSKGNLVNPLTKTPREKYDIRNIEGNRT